MPIAWALGFNSRMEGFKRIHLSIQVGLYETMIEHCKMYHLEVTEFIRSLIRREVMQYPNQNKQEQLSKPIVVGKRIESKKDVPINKKFLICPKHKAFYSTCKCD